MTSQEAKQILLAYRPWASDALDPDVAEALALCRQDTTLAKWLEEHCAVQNAIRAQFKRVQLPDGLKEQIVSEHKAHNMVVWWRQPAIVAVAAVFVIFIALGSIWNSMPRTPKEDLSFAAYRNRMVRTAVKAYGMDLVTNDVAQIRAYLEQHQSPSDYVLPKNLDPASSVGCGVLSWQGKPVTMVCFRTGKPLAPGTKSDLYLFVIDQQDVAGPPSSNTPTFAAVSTLATASWIEGGKVYLMAALDKSDLPRDL